MIPVVAPNFHLWMPVAIHPLIDSGILLTSVSAVLLNLFFNGAPNPGESALGAHAKSAAQVTHV